MALSAEERIKVCGRVAGEFDCAVNDQRPNSVGTRIMNLA